MGLRHLRIHPRCTKTIAGIANYVREEDTGKPEKLGDDVGDAIRYGLWFKDLEELREAGIKNNLLKSAPPRESRENREIDFNNLTEEEKAIIRWITQYRQS